MILLTTSTGLGVPGLSVLNDLAIFLASENDPDLFLTVSLPDTFNRFDIGTDDMTMHGPTSEKLDD